MNWWDSSALAYALFPTIAGKTLNFRDLSSPLKGKSSTVAQMAQRSTKKRIIIDGEIYEEGDPRLEQLRRQQAAPSPAQQPAQSAHPRHSGAPAQQQGGNQHPQAAAGRRSAGLDFSAPPLRVINVQGRPLPDLEIFALRVPSYYVLVLIYLVYAFGWRAAVAGAALYYIWVVNRDAGTGRPTAGQQRPAAAGGASGQGQSNPLAAGFADIMDTLGLGSNSAESAAGAQQQPGAGQAAGPGQPGGPHDGSQRDARAAAAGAAATGGAGHKPGGSGAFQGTGHKLGDK